MTLEAAECSKKQGYQLVGCLLISRSWDHLLGFVVLCPVLDVLVALQAIFPLFVLEVALLFNTHRITDSLPVCAQSAYLVVSERPPLELVDPSDGSVIKTLRVYSSSLLVT